MEDMGKIKTWQEAVSAGKDCPSLEDLHALFDSWPQENAEHVKDCPHCQAELAMLRSFESSRLLNNTEADVAGIVTRLQAQSVISTPPPARKWSWHGFFRLPYFAGAGAAALVASLGISLYILNRAEKPALKGDISEQQTWRSASVRLTVPSGNLAQAPENFQWEGFPGAKSYSIELLEVDGSLVWRGKSDLNILPASPELKAKIQPGKPLLWKVTALDASGTAIATSNQEHFVVKPMNGKTR